MVARRAAPRVSPCRNEGTHSRVIHSWQFTGTSRRRSSADTRPSCAFARPRDSPPRPEHEPSPAARGRTANRRPTTGSPEGGDLHSSRRRAKPMKKKNGLTLSRRDVLKIGAAAGAATAVGAIAGRPTAAAAQTPAGSCTGLLAIEAFPTSPLILNPFVDALPVPKAARPIDPAVVATWSNTPGPGIGQQDSAGGTHQLWPGTAGTVVANYPGTPIIYQNKLQVAPASFTTSPVRTLVGYTDTKGNIIPAGTVTTLPKSTIYGFNGQFPGPMINAEYGKPVIVRF